VVAWVVSAVALLVAVAALALIRRQARQLESLTRSYWELRYDYTRLRSRLSRLDPEDAAPAEPPVDTAPPSVSFVPLSAMRKKDK
jgi:hypothetical protein